MRGDGERPKKGRGGTEMGDKKEREEDGQMDRREGKGCSRGKRTMEGQEQRRRANE